MPRQFGHREGVKAFKKIVRYCKDIGINCISFFVFSTENWSRPKEEVDTILGILDQYLDDVRRHIGEEVRVVFLGDKSVFRDSIQKKMFSLEQDSRDFSKMTLLLAINYGGRDDIVHAMKSIAKLVQNKMLLPEQINEDLVSSFLYTAGMPDVDLLIRSGAEQRVSNFLMWQSAYAELFFTDVLWPDFSVKDLDKAIKEYAARSRRFGGVSQ